MNEKKPLIITIVVLVIILILGGVGVYFLQFEHLAKLELDLEDVSKKVDEANRKKNRIPGLLKQIAQLKDKEKELIVKIPDLVRAEYDVLANLLDELRKRAGVSVSRGGWQNPQAQGRGGRTTPATVHKVEYSITADGSFYQLLRYVNLLEQQKRHINIESLSFGRGTEPMAGPAGAGRSPQARLQARRELRVVLSTFTYRPPNVQNLLPQKAAEERSGQSTELPD